MMIKGSIQKEDRIVLNLYVPNNLTPKYVKLKLTRQKGEIMISPSYLENLITFFDPLT